MEVVVDAGVVAAGVEGGASVVVGAGGAGSVTVVVDGGAGGAGLQEVSSSAATSTPRRALASWPGN